MTGLTLAVPKGRVLSQLAPLFEAAGLDARALLADDRKLIRELGGGVRCLLLKPDDVPTYVEYGAADLGVCGRDVLLERRYDLYQPLELGIGRCRMVVAEPAGPAAGAAAAGAAARATPDVPRVATKYPHIAATHFAGLGIQAEVVFVQGSVELAPHLGLAHLIVDLVESGVTLRENGLRERETICDVSSVLIANRSLYKLRRAEIAPLVERLRAAVEARAQR